MAKKIKLEAAGIVKKLRGTLNMDHLKGVLGWLEGDSEIKLVLRQGDEEIELDEDFEIAVEFEARAERPKVRRAKTVKKNG